LQNIIDTAINEQRKRSRACMHADRQHVEKIYYDVLIRMKKLWRNKV